MADGLLLVAHGTRSADGTDEMLTLGRFVEAARPDVLVETGFLELSDPPAAKAMARLVERGADRVAVVPLMLTSAGHAKSDGPALCHDAVADHPGLTVRYGRPLGVDAGLLAIAHDRLSRAGGTGLPLLVVARGTSDPDANADAYRAARLLWEWGRPPFVEVAYTGLAEPTVTQALDRARRLGADRVAAFAWFLATGVLLERMRRDFAAHDLEVVEAGYFGPDPGLVPIVVDRYREAMGADIRMNCDACAYRAPYPGLEDRVGQPKGVGHSHLAEEHRSRMGTSSGRQPPADGAASPHDDHA